MTGLFLLLGGCAGLTGTGGSSKLACKAPDGVTCSSLSGVYANALAGNLPGLQQKHGKEASHASNSYASTPKGKVSKAEIVGETPSSGMPIFTKPEVMRIWVAPWEDAEGDLHDQAYMYVVANDGRWAIEHNEKQIMNRYMPTVLRQSSASGQQNQDTPKEKKIITNGSMTLPENSQINSFKLPGQ